MTRILAQCFKSAQHCFCLLLNIQTFPSTVFLPLEKFFVHVDDGRNYSLNLVCYHPPLNLLYNGHQVSRARVPPVAPNVSAFNSQPPHQPFMGLDTDWRIEVQSTFGQSVKDIQYPSVPSTSNKNGFQVSTLVQKFWTFVPIPNAAQHHVCLYIMWKKRDVHPASRV